jgi:hypothetical protein
MHLHAPKLLDSVVSRHRTSPLSIKDLLLLATRSGNSSVAYDFRPSTAKMELQI